MPNPFPTSPLAADEPRETRWLWRGRAPLEAITSLQGDGGAGKSTFLRWLAARVTTGDLPGDLFAEPGNALWLNIEEHAGRDIRPGLDRQGVDASRVYRPNGRGCASIIRFPQHLERLRDTVIERSARLVVIDQANAFFGSNREQDLREAMLGLREIAEDNDCAIVLNRNLNGARGADPYRRGRGGGLIVDICRAAYHLGMHPDDDQTGRRVLASIKRNVRGAASQALIMMEDVAGRLVIGDEIDLDAADLLPRRSRGRSEREETSLEVAVASLQAYLDGRELPTEEVVQAAADRGISRRTLERARAEIGVLHRRVSIRNPDGSTTHQTVLRLPGFAVPDGAAAPAPAPSQATPAGLFSGDLSTPPAQRVSGADDASVRFGLLELDLPADPGGLGGTANGAPVLGNPTLPTPSTPSGESADRDGGQEPSSTENNKR